MSTNYNFLYVSQVTLNLFYFHDNLLKKPGRVLQNPQHSAHWFTCSPSLAFLANGAVSTRDSLNERRLSQGQGPSTDCVLGTGKQPNESMI